MDIYSYNVSVAQTYADTHTYTFSLTHRFPCPPETDPWAAAKSLFVSGGPESWAKYLVYITSNVCVHTSLVFHRHEMDNWSNLHRCNIRPTYLPFGILVRKQLPLVWAGQNHQTTVFPIHSLHGRPGTDDTISWAESEIVQVLMHGVARCLLAWWRENDITLTGDVALTEQVMQKEKITLTLIGAICTYKYNWWYKIY